MGKNSVTPEFVNSVSEALKARELIKVNVLKNCEDSHEDVARTVAERTRSVLVQVIGRKFVLYKRNEENPIIELPKKLG